MKKIPYLITFITFVLTLTTCNTKGNDNALSFYGGIVQNSNYSNSNYTRSFNIEPAYDEEGNVCGSELYMFDKAEINKKKIAVHPTNEGAYIHRLFVTEDYLYVPRYIVSNGTQVIDRINLKDFSVERILETTRTAEKLVFGLSFSFNQLENSIGLEPDFVFSNDKDVFFSAHNKGIFKVMPDKTAKNIIADKIEYDVAYDGNYIFYVTVEGVLKQYEIKSGKTEILTDKTVTPYTLKVTKEDITFESDKEKVTIKR